MDVLREVLDSLVSNPEIISSLTQLVLLVLLSVGSVLVGKFKIDKRNEDIVIGILKRAVRKINTEFVEPLKLRKGFGPESKKRARELAWNAAKDIGKNEGVDLLKHISEEYADDAIEKAIGLVKARI